MPHADAFAIFSLNILFLLQNCNTQCCAGRSLAARRPALSAFAGTFAVSGPLDYFAISRGRLAVSSMLTVPGAQSAWGSHLLKIATQSVAMLGGSRKARSPQPPNMRASCTPRHYSISKPGCRKLHADA